MLPRSATRSCCPLLVAAYFSPRGLRRRQRPARDPRRLGRVALRRDQAARRELDRPGGRTRRRRRRALVGATTAYTVWENEFFNRSVDTVYDLGEPGPGRAARDALRRARRAACSLSRRARGRRPVRARRRVGRRRGQGRRIRPAKRRRPLPGRRPARAADARHRGSIPTRGRAAASATRARLHRRHARGRAQSDAQLFTGDQTVTATSERPGASASRTSRRSATERLTVPLRAGRRRASAASSSPSRDTAVPGEGQARQHRHAPARRPLPQLRLPPVRIAFDVSPALPRADGREQLHPRLARRARADGVASAATRSSPSRRPRPPGRRVIPEALAGCRVELRLVALPGAHAWRTRLVDRSACPPPSAGSAASTLSTSPTGCIRRSGPASARRRSTTSCRSTSPSG